MLAGVGVTGLTAAELVAWRRHAVGLARTDDADPSAVVRHRLAFQAQDHRPTLWSVGQRCASPTTETTLDGWFDAGHAVRTHVLRSTWHLVAPEDLRWLLTLTASRVQQTCAPIYRELGLDAATRRRATDVIGLVLGDRAPLTRRQLGVTLARHGFDFDGRTLGHLMMHAELEQVVCSGPMSGRQHTYALMDDRVPPPDRSLDLDEAVAELIRRYLAGHGPASVADLAWWSSLTLTTLRAGLEALAGDVHRFDVDGSTYWAVGEPPGAATGGPTVELLATFDEYVIGFSQTRRLVVPHGLPETSPGRFTNTVVVDGLVTGGWRRTVRPADVEVVVTLDRELSTSEHEALEATVARYGDFLGRAASWNHR